MASSVTAVISFLISSSLAAQGPCDIFATDGNPCVAAHSTVRALFSAYNGALYQVKRSSDNTLLDIKVRSPGGVADAASQDGFCSGTNCVIERIYDQSPQANHLNTAPGGGNAHEPDAPVNATQLKRTVGGSEVYGAYFEGGMGYRNDNTSGVAVGNAAETMYFVISGKHFNDGCCFDYGNAETNNDDDGKSTMECVYFGTNNNALSHPGAGKGPWIMADLENGLWAGNNSKVNEQNTPIDADFVFAMLKGGENGWALKGGDVYQSGGELKVLFDGPRPAGYQPMNKQGAIILGIGGDNSNRAIGTFFEGVMTSGYTSDDADKAVFENVIAAKYGYS